MGGLRLLALGAGLVVGSSALACDRPHPVDVVTLNTWGLPPPLAPRRGARMAAIADWVETHDADIVALQEVWRGAVPLLPLPLARAETVGDDGLGVVDRPGLQVLGSIRFDQARGFDALKRKGAQAVRWTTDAVPVTVVVTHLQSGRGRANGRVRAAQVAQILDWIAPQAGPVVLLGDLNLVDGDPHDAPAIEALAGAGLVDLAPGGEGTWRTLDHRYDRILVRDGARWRWAPEHVEVVRYDEDPGTDRPGPLSDHLPVHAHLHLVGPG